MEEFSTLLILLSDGFFLNFGGFCFAFLRCQLIEFIRLAPRKGGDLVDIMKAGAKGTTKGAINATISYTLDKTVGKLAGKGKELNQSDFSKTLSNYGGATGKITNKITSGDAVGGGANTAVSMITEKTGMNDAIDKFFGSPTAHADAAAQAAKRISDAASGIR